MSIKGFLGLALVVGIIILIDRCSMSKFDIGDNLIAQRDIVVNIYDDGGHRVGNCTIRKDSPVTIAEFSSRLVYEGNGAFSRQIKLSSPGCTGWTENKPSLNRKLR